MNATSLNTKFSETWRARQMVMLFLRSFAWGNQFLLCKERLSLYRFSEDHLLTDSEIDIREGACEFYAALCRAEPDAAVVSSCVERATQKLDAHSLKSSDSLISFHAAVLCLSAALQSVIT